MTALTTIHLTQVLGTAIYSSENEYLGVVNDLLINNDLPEVNSGESHRPLIEAIKTGTRDEPVYYDFRHFRISRTHDRYNVVCSKKRRLDELSINDYLPLRESILNKQIVDLEGRKLVRVNDVRIVSIAGGTYVIAVDVGFEGLLRKLGILTIARSIARLFRFQIPSKFILWDEVDTLDAFDRNIRLGTSINKLKTLHPSDLADIIEELDHSSRAAVFLKLDEEQAADVLEEMEPKKQVDLIESLSVAKAADLLEKMPADEAADILDMLEEEKAEVLLREMETESSEEVRELLEYSDRSVGSIMSTDFLSFHENETVEQALHTIRETKPEESVLYNLFIVNHGGRLIGTVSVRNLIVSDPSTLLKDIMQKNPVYVKDEDKLDSLAEIISKYNLLAVPVINNHFILEGMVIIDDIVDDLLGERKTR
jgi:CBS domain-containing protein/sporulation protein YlmC with PRC-barrel domain